MSHPDPSAQPALLLLATEWWKSTRRLLRLAAEAAPDRVERERAQATYAARRINAALAGLGLRLADHDGQPYSPAMPAEPVNPEDFDTEEGLVVAETIEPTVLLDGRIVQRGKVVLRRAGVPRSGGAAGGGIGSGVGSAPHSAAEVVRPDAKE